MINMIIAYLGVTSIRGLEVRALQLTPEMIHQTSLNSVIDVFVTNAIRQTASITFHAHQPNTPRKKRSTEMVDHRGRIC